MAPIARRPYLNLEEGCTWQTQQCDQISTIAEAENYVRAHSSECIFSPVVVEERLHRRGLEAAATARRVAAEVEASEERREERAYQRQRKEDKEALEATAVAAR